MCSYLSNHRLDTKVAHINLDDKWSKSDVTPKSIMLIDWSFILMIQHKVVHLCVHYHPAQIRTVGNRKVHRQKITEKVICHFGDQSASSISATNHRRRRKFCIPHNLTQSHLGTYYWSSNTSINRDPKRLAPLILSMTVHWRSVIVLQPRTKVNVFPSSSW